MKGYLNRPDATADTIDPEGWLHTGDVGVVDKHGYLTIVDRVKELIKFRGLQVWIGCRASELTEAKRMPSAALFFQRLRSVM